MEKRSLIALLIVGATLHPTTGALPPTVDGIVGVAPVGEHSCISMEIHVGSAALSGLRWYNNDADTVFPAVLLMESSPGTDPSLDATGVVLENIVGASDDWSELLLDTPVTSSTGSIHVVFVLPPNVQRTGDGEGEGPGFGYSKSSADLRSHISADGEAWAQVHSDYRLAVDAIISYGKNSAATLASLRDEAQYSFSGKSEAPSRYQSHLLPAAPNPFNPETVLQFTLSNSSHVSLTLYNVRGQKINTLHEGRLPAGLHRLSWSGDDSRGQSVASGVYLVRMIADGEAFRQRLVLVK